MKSILSFCRLFVTVVLLTIAPVAFAACEGSALLPDHVNELICQADETIGKTNDTLDKANKTLDMIQATLPVVKAMIVLAIILLAISIVRQVYVLRMMKRKVPATQE